MADGITRYTTLSQFDKGIKTLEKQLKSPDATPEMKEIARKRLPKYKAQMASLDRDANKEIHARLDEKNEVPSHDPDLAVVIRKYQDNSLSRADLTLYPGPSDFEKDLNEFEERFGGDNLLTTVKGAMAIALLDVLGVDLLLVNGAKFLMNPATMAGIAKALSAFVLANPVAAVCLAAVAYLGAKKLFGPMVRKAQARREIAHAFSSEAPSVDSEKGEINYAEILRKYDEAHPAGSEHGDGDPAPGTGDPTGTPPPAGKGDPAGKPTAEPVDKPKTDKEFEKAMKEAAKKRNKAKQTMDKAKIKRDAAKVSYDQYLEKVKETKKTNGAVPEKMLDDLENSLQSVEEAQKAYEEAESTFDEAQEKLSNIQTGRLDLWESKLKKHGVIVTADDRDKQLKTYEDECVKPTLMDYAKDFLKEIGKSASDYEAMVKNENHAYNEKKLYIDPIMKKYGSKSTETSAGHRDFVVNEVFERNKGKKDIHGNDLTRETIAKHLDDSDLSDADKKLIRSVTVLTNYPIIDKDIENVKSQMAKLDNDITAKKQEYDNALEIYANENHKGADLTGVTSQVVKLAQELQELINKHESYKTHLTNLEKNTVHARASAASDVGLDKTKHEDMAYKDFTNTFNNHVQNLLGIDGKKTGADYTEGKYAEKLRTFVYEKNDKGVETSKFSDPTLTALFDKLVEVMGELERVKDKDVIKKKLSEMGLTEADKNKLFTGDFAKDMNTLMGKE